MLLDLSIPVSGPVPEHPAAPPVAGRIGRRRSLDVKGMLTGLQNRCRRHIIERSNLECSLGLLVCGVMFGLLVGGFVGYMQAATPAADPPGSLSHLVVSDVGWTAMVGQNHAHATWEGPLHQAIWSKQLTRRGPSSVESLDAACR